MLYDALIAPHAEHDAPFLVDDAGRVLSYRAFVQLAARVAAVLLEQRVRPGDRVVAQVPKTTEAVALYAACLQIGAVYLPLNSAYTGAELAYFLTDATPAVVVCDAADENSLRSLTDAPVLTLSADGGGSLATAAEARAPSGEIVPRGPEDLAGLLYTSGTTGRSKGAMMSHRNLLSNARALTDLWRITDADRLIHALPIFHTHGLFVALNTALLAGAEVRFMARFDAEVVLKALPGATLMMGVPTFYTRLLDHPDLTRAATANMRLFISGSAPLLAETHEAWTARTGHRILERYGMTETNMITSNPYDGDRVPGTVGHALPGVEVQVCDADGTPLPAGEIGVIEVRGPNVFSGYWQMPEKTAEEIRPNGFFITGDLGVMDADGRVTIVGRQKDLIITGGYNVYPKEVEDVLNAIPGILESAVFAGRDADFGEKVMAALVRAPGSAVTEAEIAERLSDQLARFKHPRALVWLEALPRNTMGKVQKNVLRAEHG